ncbi:SGNH/GDSL hydrolase family protein [Rhodobacteraceae bacterium CCMM004]|nr:SGNH/GDSL hydrolase family protein [Rhodobacteraceae bacterium CCMM004]
MTLLRRTVGALICLAALAGCARTIGDGPPRLLAVGDSVMAWNAAGGQSIPAVVARETGLTTRNAAVPGAGLLPGTGLAGLTIVGQIEPGRYDWAIANGGANDLDALCGCARCPETLDRLLTRDGTRGAWVDMVARLRAAGAARVLILGYYGPARTGRGGGYDRCNDEVAEMDRRLARLAARRADVVHVTARDVFDGDPALYARDLVHPSPAGSARIGRLIARTIAAGG